MNNKKQPYTHLLVDWDGTIQDTLSIWLTATMKALSERNISLSENFVSHHILSSLISAKDYGVTDIDIFIDTVVADSVPHLPEAPIDTDLWQELIHLRDVDIQMSIVTIALESGIRKALEYHQLDDLPFQHIVGSDTPGLKEKRKPDPAPLDFAMKLMGGSETARPLMIGDSKVDILAGQAYGCDTLLYYPQRNETTHDLESLLDLHPTHCARTVEELKQIILTTS